MKQNLINRNYYHYSLEAQYRKEMQLRRDSMGSGGLGGKKGKKMIEEGKKGDERQKSNQFFIRVPVSRCNRFQMDERS